MLTWWAVLGNRYAWYAHADGDTLVVPVFLRHRLLSLSTTHMVYCRGRGSGCGGPLFAVSADVAAEFPSLNKTLTGQGDPPNDIMFSDMIRDLNSSVCYALGDDGACGQRRCLTRSRSAWARAFVRPGSRPQQQRAAVYPIKQPTRNVQLMTVAPPPPLCHAIFHVRVVRLPHSFVTRKSLITYLHDC